MRLVRDTVPGFSATRAWSDDNLSSATPPDCLSSLSDQDASTSSKTYPLPTDFILEEEVGFTATMIS
jgi:hypothetical protein